MRVPYAVRDVVLSRDGEFGLITGNHDDVRDHVRASFRTRTQIFQAVAQLFRLDPASGESGGPVKLALGHFFKPKSPGVDMTATSIFGGRRDEIVLCTSEGAFSATYSGRGLQY